MGAFWVELAFSLELSWKPFGMTFASILLGPSSCKEAGSCLYIAAP